ncbi:MAG TPA: hypothetical protein VE082_04805, partial [Desulfobaccales bacterium]|nr:hypothetical protein [Desulfobaccales bacterium]
SLLVNGSGQPDIETVTRLASSVFSILALMPPLGFALFLPNWLCNPHRACKNIYLFPSSLL